MSHITTKTGNELYGATNIDYLERPWAPKITDFSVFIAISGCDSSDKFLKCITPKWLKIDQINLHMKFSALNVDFSSPIPTP